MGWNDECPSAQEPAFPFRSWHPAGAAFAEPLVAVCGHQIVQSVAQATWNQSAGTGQQGPGATQMGEQPKHGFTSEMDSFFVVEDEAVGQGSRRCSQQILDAFGLQRGEPQTAATVVAQHPLHRPLAQVAMTIEKEHWAVRYLLAHGRCF